jgi:hypothetical protein
LQAEQYEKFNNGPGAYGAWFRLADLIVTGIPRHQEFKKPSSRQKELLLQYREIVRSKALPRLETLKPLLNGTNEHPSARPGTALIQTSNLPGIDWASQTQTAPSVAEPPAPTVDANAGGWTSAGAVLASDDPFAASVAFQPSAQLQSSQYPPAGTSTGVKACRDLPQDAREALKRLLLIQV